MLAHRISQHSARQLLAKQPTLLRFTPPIATAANTLRPQARHVAFQPSATEPSAQTQPATPSTAYAILAAQRLNRPIAPHLSIYRPQITWYGSALNRITGSVLSGGVYVFATAYLASPLLGWHLESGAVAEWFGGFGGVTKGVLKFGVSWPVTYHFWAGIRHLVWDTGRQFSNKQVQVTGWAVVGLSVACSAVLAFVGGS